MGQKFLCSIPSSQSIVIFYTKSKPLASLSVSCWLSVHWCHDIFHELNPFHPVGCHRYKVPVSLLHQSTRSSVHLLLGFQLLFFFVFLPKNNLSACHLVSCIYDWRSSVSSPQCWCLCPVFSWYLYSWFSAATLCTISSSVKMPRDGWCYFCWMNPLPTCVSVYVMNGVACGISGINDKHIWFSVCGRPCLSNFTRAQRLVCCLTLVLGYIISNIMFFGIDPPPDDWRIGVGPVQITRTEIAIGNSLFYLVNLLYVKLWICESHACLASCLCIVPTWTVHLVVFYHCGMIMMLLNDKLLTLFDC